MTNLATQMSDYSIEDAVTQMPDIEALEAANPDLQRQDNRTNDTIRDESGRFKAREPAPDAKADTENPDVAKVKDESPADTDDDPFVEFAAEEGKEPVREKLSKVWEGYTKAQQLEQELQSAKNSQRVMLPHEVEQVVSHISTQRQNLISQMQRWASSNTPVAPSLTLVNPDHPDYNPELFNQQVQQYQMQKARLAEVAQEIETQQATAQKEQEAVLRARANREWQRIQEVWPEYAQSKDSQQKARSELKQRYGFDDETINSVIDSRFYALAKDALAFHTAKAKEAEAVKVVKAKPKLVSGIARQNATSQQRASADGLKRLQMSGSLEDAAAALDGLF